MRKFAQLSCLFAAASSAALLGCGEDPLSVAEILDLAAAEQKWAARGFNDYAFVTRQSCFCTPEALLQVEVEVREGRVASVTDVAADTLIQANLHGLWYTIDDLFERIRTSGAGDLVTDVVVAFDPALGYPTSFATRFDETIVDAGIRIEVSDLRRLDPLQPGLTELAPGFSYTTWFAQHTGFTPHPDDFGVYSIEPAFGTLYLGIGAGAPAERDGSLLAAFDNGGVRPIGPLDEQGFLDMLAVGDTLLIPGVDPCCPDDWAAGNFYTYSPSAGLTKHRNLPNVIHAWRVWYEESDGAVFVVTGSHLGDFATWTGEIWRSTDYGASWTRVANHMDSVGGFRTNDLVRLHDRFYAIRADSFFPCDLITEPTNSSTWQNAIPGQDVACHHALVIFGDQLIALSATRDVLHLIPQGGSSALTVNLPFTVGSLTFNWATAAGGSLFAVADDGRIWRSQDATSWETVASGSQESVSIGYWPHRSWLMLGSRGADGGVWKLRLCGADPC